MSPATNLSVLDLNVLHAFRGVSSDPAALDEAEAIYLRHRDLQGCLWSEAVALEWLDLSARLAPMLDAAARGHGQGDTTAVRDFIRDRFYHWRNPAQRDGRTPFRGPA
jgi:hypothetical protein